MTNFEKCKDEILKIIKTSRSGIAGIKDGILFPCNMINCSECNLNRDGSNCIRNFIKWLYEDGGETPDGCDDCKYEYKKEDESPCTECCNNYTSKWERRPKKTRQDEFLEHYPEARIKNSLLDVCPQMLNMRFDCKIKDLSQSCIICRQDYWLQEVEE